MRDPELKVLSLWTAWVLTLSGITAGSYRYWPRTEPPAVEILADRSAFDGERLLTVTFRRRNLAPRPIPIQFELGGTAEQGPQYEIVEAPGGVVIRPGEREAKLVLRPRPLPKTRPGESVHEEIRIVKVRLLDGEGYVADITKSAVELALRVRTVTPQESLPKVRVSSTAREFSDKDPLITIDFDLDRKLTYPLEVAFTLGGDASDRDYQIQSRPSTDFLVFDVGVTRRSITLKRVEDDSNRGKGDRWAIVSFRTMDSFAAGSPSQVKIRVPDPAAKLSWSLSEGSVRRTEDKSVHIKVALSKPRSDTVTLRYRIAVDPGVEFAAPAGYFLAENIGVVTLPPGRGTEGISREVDFLVRGSDVVGGPPLKLRLECLEVEPAEVASGKDLPGPLTLTTTDEEALSGKGLVLVVLTETLMRDWAATLGEVAALAETSKEDLVGRSIYLLDAEGPGTIRRFDPSKGIPKGAKPFPDKARFETILGAAYKGVARQFGSRVASPARSAFIVWRDASDRDPSTFAEDEYRTPPKDYRWHLFFIGEEGDLAKILALRFPPDDAKNRRYHRIADPSRNVLRNAIGNLMKLTGR